MNGGVPGRSDAHGPELPERPAHARPAGAGASDVASALREFSIGARHSADDELALLEMLASDRELPSEMELRLEQLRRAASRRDPGSASDVSAAMTGAGFVQAVHRHLGQPARAPADLAARVRDQVQTHARGQRASHTTSERTHAGEHRLAIVHERSAGRSAGRFVGRSGGRWMVPVAIAATLALVALPVVKSLNLRSPTPEDASAGFEVRVASTLGGRHDSIDGALNLQHATPATVEQFFSEHLGCDADLGGLLSDPRVRLLGAAQARVPGAGQAVQLRVVVPDDIVALDAPTSLHGGGAMGSTGGLGGVSVRASVFVHRGRGGLPAGDESAVYRIRPCERTPHLVITGWRRGEVAFFAVTPTEEANAAVRSLMGCTADPIDWSCTSEGSPKPSR